MAKTPLSFSELCTWYKVWRTRQIFDYQLNVKNLKV